jgi:MFS family permease
MLKVDIASLRETKPHEYAMRFLFGGTCTVLAGLIAKRFGPAIGGLFLAFPAIFPAGASLIEDHEKKRKAEQGYDGTLRGRMAASVDAAGASLGCIGLMAFAIILWHWIPGRNAYWVISLATLVWMGLSTCLWALRRKRFFHRPPRSR